MTARAPGRTQIVLGLVGIAASALPVRRHRISRGEGHCFRVVNDLPDTLHGPAWIVMQLGSLAAAPAAAGVAYAAGDRRLGVRLGTSGLAAWVLAKGVKQVVRRGRPATVLDDVRHRGPEASGLGYLSGHAAVSTALVLAVAPQLALRPRLVVLAAAPVVGFSRVYVGAHLPLDIVGGASLGLLVEGVTRRFLPAGPPQPPQSSYSR